MPCLMLLVLSYPYDRLQRLKKMRDWDEGYAIPTRISGSGRESILGCFEELLPCKAERSEYAELLRSSGVMSSLILSSTTVGTVSSIINREEAEGVRQKEEEQVPTNSTTLSRRDLDIGR